MAHEKLCLFCRHLGWLHDIQGGSELTGEWGTDGFVCDKGHFSAYAGNMRDNYGGVKTVRALMLRAESCPDYKRPEDEPDA